VQLTHSHISKSPISPIATSKTETPIPNSTSHVLIPPSSKKNLLTPSYVTLPTPFISRGAEAVMGMTNRHPWRIAKGKSGHLFSWGGLNQWREFGGRRVG